MEYQLTETIKGRLKKVSPKVLKFLKENGLLELKDDEEGMKLVLEVITDPVKCEYLINCLFLTEKPVKFEDDIDFFVVMEGIKDFFVQPKSFLPN